jgi:hypothetical protein
MIGGHLMMILTDSDHEFFDPHGRQLKDKFVVEHGATGQSVAGRFQIMGSGLNVDLPAGDGLYLHIGFPLSAFLFKKIAT